MDFGKVDNPEGIDFTLPAIHPDTIELLKQSKGKQGFEFYLGCGKWGRREWLGKIYPRGIPERDFLKHYAKLFNSIELNATHYRVPNTATLEGWKKTAGKDFLFCPKFPQIITHLKKLIDVEDMTGSFLEKIAVLKENLGPVFIQLPPNFSIKQYSRLTQYLETLPKDMEFFVEFRHASWFEDNEQVDALFKRLEELKIGVICTDTLGRRDLVHLRLTTPSAFIRFVGSNLHESDYKRTDDWVIKCRELYDKGIHKIYFFLHQVDEALTPELAAYTVEGFNKHLGLKLPEMVLKEDLFTTGKG